MAVTDAQLTLYVLLPKITSALSVVGSSVILVDFFRRKRHGKGRRLSPRYRLLAGMSACDLLHSCASFLTSWPIPRDYAHSKWNVGTQGSCTAQGFFIQLSTGTVLYNCMLAVFYLLSIRQGWSDERIQLTVEKFMHAIPLCFALFTAIAALPLTLFNPLGGWECYINPYPSDCLQSYQAGDEMTTCERGDNGKLYIMLFFYVPVWTTFFVLVVCMVLVYARIYKLDRAAPSRLAGNTNARRNRFALQALLYSGTFMASYAITSIQRLRFMIGNHPPNFKVLIAGVTMIPIQGFFNMVVYKLPMLQEKARQRKRETLRTSSVLLSQALHSRDMVAALPESAQHLRHPDEERISGGGGSGSGGGDPEQPSNKQSAGSSVCSTMTGDVTTDSAKSVPHNMVVARRGIVSRYFSAESRG